MKSIIQPIVAALATTLLLLTVKEFQGFETSVITGISMIVFALTKMETNENN